jgi:outer membrane lipoprotein-sorting protein
MIKCKFFFLLLATASTCWAGGCAESLGGQPAEKIAACPVEVILRNLQQETARLESYQCRIEYLFSQPLFESQTLRKGVLYYQRSSGKSALRINFQTLKQDDDEEQKHIEHYIFDGEWLTVIDYQVKEVKRRQLAEPNKPVDAFELVSHNFPIIGFTRVSELEKEFEVRLVEQEEDEAGGLIKLNLKVKPDSIYRDDYTSIGFWIDKKLNLPAKIVATSTEDDIYQIELLDAKVNKGIDKKVFDFELPEGFGEEIIPLKKKTKDTRPKTKD